MATFFSSQIVGYWYSSENYMYGTLTGDVSRSGNTVTLSNLNLNVSLRYSGSGSGSYTFILNGTSTTWTMDASSPSHTLNNTSFVATASQTTATISWTGSDGYTGSFNITFPAGTTPPEGLSVSFLEAYTNGAKFRVGVTSWGNESGQTTGDRYFEAAIMNHFHTYGSPYIYTHGTHNIAPGSEDIVVTNDNHGPGVDLTVQPNTEYHYGAFARNYAGSSTNIISDTFVTKATVGAITPSSVTHNSATLSVAVPNQGDDDTITVGYRFTEQGEIWSGKIPIGTAEPGSSVSVTVQSLSPNTTYVAMPYVSNSSGDTDGDVITFTTPSAPVASGKLYCSVNGKSKLVKELYCSVNGKTKRVTKLYGSVGGKTKLIHGS